MSRSANCCAPSRRSLLYTAAAAALLILPPGAAAQAAPATRPGPSAADAPAGPVPVERLTARRAALLDSVGQGVVVLRSATARSVEGDYPQDNDYRERNDFFYLTGLEAPGAWLVMVAQPTGPDRTILYLPARDSAGERWTGPRLGPGPEAVALTGIADVRPADSAPAQVRRLLAEATSPARSGALYLPRDRARTPAEPLDGVLAPADTTALGIAVQPLARETAALRLVKDADELRRLRGAIDMTAASLREALAAIEPGMMEYEVEAIIEYGFRRRGAERVGFPSIVGSGINSTTLHYDRSRGRLDAGDLVVMDVGAEHGYYSADVTRTAPVSGRFTPRQRALYDLVLATQQAAIDSVRPGVTVGDLNRIARAYMREHSGTLCGEVTCDRYWIHGLSHWLGMDVHDVGDYRTPLLPGMVLTIEPGIYIPAERLGIRIEDDILVTTGAPEILSAGAPRTAAEIEGAMSR